MAIYNPVLPYVGPIGGALLPGRSVRISGTIHPGATRFALNLQSGPNLYPRDDVAVHFSPDFIRNCVVRNNILGMNWGPEETHGHFPLSRGQPFDITIHCERDCYKISINGQHYTDFIHRIPYERVTHFSVDGDITVNRIEYLGGGHGHSGMHMPMPVPMAYPPGSPGHMPHNPLPPPGPYGYYPPPHHHDHHHGGHHHHGHHGHHHGHHGYGKHHHYGGPYGPGTFGTTALGSGIVGAQFAGHHSNKKTLKAQKKAHKKALKYGLPLVGAGVGAYALHKTFHHGHHGHHGHSSSSSSSSSSSEEE